MVLWKILISFKVQTAFNLYTDGLVRELSSYMFKLVVQYHGDYAVDGLSGHNC
jgi:hypothetical protein